MRKRLYSILAAIIVSSAGLAGCTLAGDIPVTEETKYNSDFALPAHEYSYALDREITAVCNVLTSVMTQMHTVSMGEMDIDRALSALEGAEDTVKTSRDVVDRTMPAVNYEEARTKTLESMDNILVIFEDYRTLLNNANELPVSENKDTESTDKETVIGIETSTRFSMANPRVDTTDVSSRLKTEFNVLTTYQNIYFD